MSVEAHPHGEQLADGELYRFVKREEMEMQFTSLELAELSSISLPLVARLVHSGVLSNTDALKIRLAVQEAVLNGLEHGNLELDSQWKEEVEANGCDKFSSVRKCRLADPRYANRVVDIKVVYCDHRLELSVRDQGKGFLNARGVLEHCRIDSLALSGRGLALMSSSVDEVQFSDNGSQVTLIKRLPEPKDGDNYGA